MRDAAIALGSTRLEAWTHVLIPLAARGLVSASLVVFVRALGESVIVAIAAPPNTRTFAGEALRAGMGQEPALESRELLIIGAVLVVATLMLQRLAQRIYSPQQPFSPRLYSVQQPNNARERG